jgi:hypothetical protein
MPLLLALRWWEQLAPVIVTPPLPPPSDICYPRVLVGATAFSRVAVPALSFARSALASDNYARTSFAATSFQRSDFGGVGTMLRMDEPQCVTIANPPPPIIPGAGLSGYGDNHGADFGGTP